MADSDGEYVEDLSDDDLPTAAPSGGGGGRHATRSSGPVKGPEAARGRKRSMDGGGRRGRISRGTPPRHHPLQRGIIRHLILILDLSSAMTEKDLRPTRYLLTLRLTSTFITEFFEQNPISQLGILGMRDGLAKPISPSPAPPPPSLQNALEMARAALFHAPSHGTREVLLISGALLSSDPGDIHTTITSLASDHIRVSAIGLAAQVAVLSEICAKTRGDYSVALHEEHFRALFMGVTTPPPTRAREHNHSSLLMMGFPSRTADRAATLCACHSRLARGIRVRALREQGVCAARGVSGVRADADSEYAFGEVVSSSFSAEELEGGWVGGGGGEWSGELLCVWGGV
ncbi:hypothetical protein ACLOAV_002629 [Pseudogymnoascus australis]